MIPALVLALALAGQPAPGSAASIVMSPARDDRKPGTICRDLTELECSLANANADALEKLRAWERRAATLDLKLRAETRARAEDRVTHVHEVDAYLARIDSLAQDLEDADGVDPLWIVVGIAGGIVVGAVVTGLIVSSANAQ